MTSSLVGSEMCIRDSFLHHRFVSFLIYHLSDATNGFVADATSQINLAFNCLLYTSDAADDM
eukprot:7432925-Prorocentrum_lima.AAC.1